MGIEEEKKDDAKRESHPIPHKRPLEWSHTGVYSKGFKVSTTLYSIANTEYHVHMKVLLGSFHLNGHILRFYPQT